MGVREDVRPAAAYQNRQPIGPNHPNHQADVPHRRPDARMEQRRAAVTARLSSSSPQEGTLPITLSFAGLTTFIQPLVVINSPSIKFLYSVVIFRSPPILNYL